MVRVLSLKGAPQNPKPYTLKSSLRVPSIPWGFLRFGVWGLRFGVQALGFRVWGSRFGV